MTHLLKGDKPEGTIYGVGYSKDRLWIYSIFSGLFPLFYWFFPRGPLNYFPLKGHIFQLNANLGDIFFLWRLHIWLHFWEKRPKPLFFRRG